ncbi:hypothetical protein APC62_12280 [Acinetobacter pittii]|nr:hypothetical protein APC62_12280 [Acinetobacter pittii]
MEKVTKKLFHLQNLFTVFIYQEMLQKHYFINYGQAVDDSQLELKANPEIEIKIIRFLHDSYFDLFLYITFELR